MTLTKYKIIRPLTGTVLDETTTLDGAYDVAEVYADQAQIIVAVEFEGAIIAMVKPDGTVIERAAA